MQPSPRYKYGQVQYRRSIPTGRIATIAILHRVYDSRAIHTETRSTEWTHSVAFRIRGDSGCRGIFSKGFCCGRREHCYVRTMSYPFLVSLDGKAAVLVDLSLLPEPLFCFVGTADCHQTNGSFPNHFNDSAASRLR